MNTDNWLSLGAVGFTASSVAFNYLTGAPFVFVAFQMGLCVLSVGWVISRIITGAWSKL